MLIKRRKNQKQTSRDRSDCSDTCESLPRQPPPKIIQERVKHNFQKLTAVPIVVYASSIKHLYLSHNNLISLQGIQLYTSLTSLNISYNFLSKISQLRLIINPHLLKRISLRMNQFQYGYEDYAVGLLFNLERLDDCVVEKAQIKEKMFRMRANLAAGIIKFVKRCQLITDQIQSQKNKENIPSLTNIPQINKEGKAKSRSLQCHSHQLFQRLKDHYIEHTQRSLSSKTIRQLLTLTSTVIDIVNSTDIYVPSAQNYKYGETTNSFYRFICDEILIKFRQKHDNTLINYLQKNIGEGISYFTAFAQLGVIDEKNFKFEKEIPMMAGGVKCLDIDNNPAKYMQRINPTALHEHPMNYLANWTQPKYNTLIAQKDTKWYNFYREDEICRKEHEPIYEQVPVFIYCKEYLQVLTEIVLDQIGILINIDHHHSRQPKQNQQPFRYQQQKEEDIELNLSDSQIMSFGNKQEIHQLSATEDNLYSNQHQHYLQPEGEPNPALQIGQNSKKQVQLPSHFELNKFSLYQINLIFKVLRGLKKRVKKRKSKERVLGQSPI